MFTRTSTPSTKPCHGCVSMVDKREEIKELKKGIEKLEDEIKELKMDTKKLEGEIKGYEKEVSSLELEKFRIEQKMDITSRENLLLSDSNKEKRAEVNNLKKKIDQMETELRNRQTIT